jgi:hypothetical protein
VATITGIVVIVGSYGIVIGWANVLALMGGGALALLVRHRRRLTATQQADAAPAE